MLSLLILLSIFNHYIPNANNCQYSFLELIFLIHFLSRQFTFIIIEKTSAEIFTAEAFDFHVTNSCLIFMIPEDLE